MFFVSVYLLIRVTCAVCEASNRAEASAAAAPCASATVERGLWLTPLLVKLFPLPVVVL